MGRMTASARRHFQVFLFLESPAVHRRVVFGDLIDPQRRIIAPHEICVRVTPAAYIHNLAGARLADVTFLSVHRLQTHNARIAAVARRAPEALGRMDIGLVQLDRFCQFFDSERCMTSCAAIVCCLASPDAGNGQVNE